MWKLALNNANHFSKQQTVGKISDYEYFHPTILALAGAIILGLVGAIPSWLKK